MLPWPGHMKTVPTLIACRGSTPPPRGLLLAFGKLYHFFQGKVVRLGGRIVTGDELKLASAWCQKSFRWKPYWGSNSPAGGQMYWYGAVFSHQWCPLNPSLKKASGRKPNPQSCYVISYIWVQTPPCCSLITREFIPGYRPLPKDCSSHPLFPLSGVHHQSSPTSV